MAASPLVPSVAYTRIVPSSSMSICTSYSDSSERIVSPPLPITMPMNSGLIWIDRSAVLGECLARCRDRRLHRTEDRAPGVLRLRQRLLHDPRG
jgi:hypothetical protein